MRNKTPFIILLIMSVLAASIFCCCLTERAEAKLDLPPCHQKGDHSKANPERECECTQIQTLAALQSFDVSKPGINEVVTFDAFAAINGPIVEHREIYLLLASSFENSESSPPLYLKYSNFRL